MKELVYNFERNGYYLSNGSTKASFGDDTNMRLKIEPIEYEIKVGGDVLNTASCKGYLINVCNNGEVEFCDYSGVSVAKKQATENVFDEIKFEWSPNKICVDFGSTEEVDYYPNCDGEHDRYGIKWNSKYKVTLKTDTNVIE